MLWRLLRTYLAPFHSQLGLVVLLQLGSTIASLYLPSINGDIIDRGVATGDTALHARARRDDAGDRGGPDRLLDRRGVHRRARRDGLRPRPARRDLSSRRRAVGARGRQVRRAVADHAHDERRPAGADARADEHDDARDGADHVRRRHRDGAARGPRAVEAAARLHPGAGRQHRPHHRPDDPEVPRSCSRRSTP